MKKLLVFLLICISFTFCGCNNNVNSKTNSATSSVSDEKIADNIYFRKGTEADGEIILTSKDVISVEVGFNYNKKYVISMSLNDDGTKKFAEATTELAKTNGIISIWVGDEMISDPTVQSAITEGKCQISGTFADGKSVDRLVDKMHAKS